MAVILALPLVSCGSQHPYGASGAGARIGGFAGYVVADEPRAALAGRDVLEAGGTAADAAVAAAFVLSATLPSQSALGAGGVCLAFDHATRSAETLNFVVPPQNRPVPAMARGLYALYSKYGGGMPWEQLVLPAERIARLGQPVSRALARGLAAWPSGEIDPATKAVFFRPDGRPLAEGDNLQQLALGATLSRLRLNGVGALYDGNGAALTAASLAGIAANAPAAAEIRAFMPQWHAAGKVEGKDGIVYFPGEALQPVGEGQVWNRVGAGPGLATDARIKSILEFFVQRGAPVQPSSTGIVAVARSGSAVACDFSMGRPFGGARVATETGLMLATAPLPALQPVIATDGSGAFRFALAAPPASAQVAAPAGLAVVACGEEAPRQDSCRAASDPKGAGLASSAGGE